MPCPRWLATVLFSLSLPAHACWEQAARHYGVPAPLLYAIAEVESSLNPAAINDSHRSRTGSYDIGLMQINSRHLGRLAGLGIREADLYQPCINIHIGAWLLADLFSRLGASWEAVGAYNAACTHLRGSACQQARARYAWKVYRHLQHGTNAKGSSPAPDDRAGPLP